MAQVLLLNPRKRRASGKRKAGASPAQRAWRKKFAATYGGGKRHANPKKRRRVAKKSGTMQSIRRHGKAVSRTTWKASGYTRNPRSRRHYRRNPASVVRGNVTSITRVLTESAQGAVGAIVVDSTMGFVAPMLPAMLLGAYTYPATKAAVAIGLGIAGEKFLPSAARKWVAEGVKGSLTTTIHSVLQPMVAGILPLGRMRGMGYINPGYVPPRSIPAAGMKGLREYMSETPMQRESVDYGPGYQNMGEYMSEYLPPR